MQFLPHDPTKFLVTSADSQVRIVDGGLNVIEKYKGMYLIEPYLFKLIWWLIIGCSPISSSNKKLQCRTISLLLIFFQNSEIYSSFSLCPGLRNAGNQISASFTSQGKHIVSASEDSNIYIWNYKGRKELTFSQPKVVKSCEFFSADASVAITWPGLKSNDLHDSSLDSLPFLSSTGFSVRQEFPIDTNSRGSATWPEEKLPISSPRAVTSSMSKSEYKLFRSSCQSSSTSHAWNMVILTAGFDGRIRSFHNYGLPIPL